MHAATTNGPATLLDLFHSDRQLRGLETADLCVTVSHFRRGTFKTSHQAKRLAMHGQGPWPPTHISRFDIVAKRMYRTNSTGALERYPTEKELACLLDEGNLLLWCNALQTDCDLHVKRRIEEFGPPPSPIPELRFVIAAIATVVSRTQRPGGKHVFVPSMTGAYLLEERLTGRFVKYINNSECRPAAYLSPKDGVYYENALYLCFCQHLQYWMTDGMAYISDYQGNDKILTDTQIITNPKRFKKNLFGDGNYTSAFETFPTKHECNKYCKWFGLDPFSQD